MPHDETTIILDTNSLLHYPPIKDTDWKAACDSQQVRLVLCLQVIHELDEKKTDPKLSERAARIIKEIRGILAAGGDVEEGVTLGVFNYELRAADFPDTLSPDSKDDRIVHSAKKFIEQNTPTRIAVYTEDLGMILRCEANGIEVVEPDSANRLESPQSEQDKKYRLAITELNELKNRVPVLELIASKEDADSPRKDLLKFELVGPPSARGVEAEYEQYKVQHGLVPMGRTELPGGATRLIPAGQDAIDSYNDKLERHLKAYREWLEHRALLEVIAAHSIKFSLWLTNVGVAPADDIDVTVEIEDVLFSMVEANSKEAKQFILPGPPQPPQRPKQRFVDAIGLGEFLRPMHYELPDYESLFVHKATVEKIPNDRGFRVQYSTGRLKHNDHIHLGDLIAVVRPDLIRPFQMRFRITAANLVKPIVGEIPVIITKGNSTE
jgi:hypothetical protein